MSPMAPVTLLVVRNVVFSLLGDQNYKIRQQVQYIVIIFFCFDYAILSSSAIEYQMYMETILTVIGLIHCIWGCVSWLVSCMCGVFGSFCFTGVCWSWKGWTWSKPLPCTSKKAAICIYNKGMLGVLLRASGNQCMVWHHNLVGARKDSSPILVGFVVFVSSAKRWCVVVLKMHYNVWQWSPSSIHLLLAR